MSNIFRYFTYILLCFAALEVVFHPSIEDIYATSIILIGWYMITRVFVRQDRLEKYPFVSMMFLALAFYFFYLPLPITFVEGKPVCFNLQMPLATFSAQIAYLICLLLAFRIAIRFKNPHFKGFLRKLNFYYQPTTMGYWIIGLIGLASMMFYVSHTTTRELQSTMNKVMESFNFLATAPLVMMVLPDKMLKGKKGAWWWFVLYLFALIICAVLTNRRHYLFLYVMTPMLIWVILKFRTRNIVIKFQYLLLSLFGIYLLLGPVSDFCLAMSVQRRMVNEIGGRELLDNTIAAYQDKEVLQMQYRYFSEEQIDFSSIGYTEYYVDNILFNRLCNMKPIDNSIYYASMLDWVGGDSYMQQKFIERLIYLLPADISSIIFPHFDKSEYIHYGYHDYLINRAMGTGGGGFRVGGDTGIGLATFGIFFFLFVIVFYSFFFRIVNCFTLDTKTGIIFSLFALCCVFQLFYVFQTNHGFMDHLQLVLRRWPQSIVLYLMVINALKWLKI